MKRRALAVLMLSITVLSIATFGFARPAQAVINPMICTPAFEALDGRCMNQSYFGGGDYNSNTGESVFGSKGNALGSGNYYSYIDSLGSDGLNVWDIPPDVDNGVPGAANNFINFMHAYLFNQTDFPDTFAIFGCSFPNDITAPSTGWTIAASKPCDPFRSRMIGAAYIVLNMLGGKYDQYDVGPLFTSGPYGNPVQNGVYQARQEFNTWSQEVLQADAAGNINWNEVESLPSGHPNTQASDYTHDIQMFQQGAEVRHSIVFNNPGGQYILNRRCANTVSFAPLAPVPDMNMQAYIGGSVYDSTGAAVSSLSPGGTYTISAGTENTGTANSNNVYLELKTPGNTANVSIDTVDGPYGVADGWSASNNCQPGYAMNPPGACTGPHWWWQYNGIAPGSGPLWQTAKFTVTGGIGTNICFQSDVVHQYSLDPASYSQSPQTCLPVVTPRYPSVIGTGADIHAGGGLCGAAQNPNGVIDALSQNLSLGQYVVSASSAINNFGSNNIPASSKLTMGNSGTYAAVCRPDLYGYATTNMHGASWQTNSGSLYDLSTDFTGQSVVFMNANGSQVRIQGVLNHPLTIVVNGGVHVENDITLAGGTGRGTLPSLGIIASGDVTIQCDCAQPNVFVDAFIFSNGTIDTCENIPAGIPSPPHCDNRLHVYGFLEGANILLHRLGIMNTTGPQVSEETDMNPALYLNPPPYFDNGVDIKGLDSQGEQPPLF